MRSCGISRSGRSRGADHLLRELQATKHDRDKRMRLLVLTGFDVSSELAEDALEDADAGFVFLSERRADIPWRELAGGALPQIPASQAHAGQ